MHLKKIVSLFFIVSIVFITNNGYSWGDVGHKTIAYIAEKNLSIKTLKKINSFLSKEGNIISVSTWADKIKESRPFTKPWHYIDLPIRKNINKSDIPKYVNGDSNIISQINLKITDLKDNNTDPAVKQEDLMFIIHFIGDLHCPL